MLEYLILSYVLSNMFQIFFELKSKVKYKWIQFLISKTYCWKCLSFWLTLFSTGNIFLASQVSLLAIIIEEGIEIIKEKFKI